ncbi:DUF4376 domain-containing protein [Bradyrhizobium japonicum]|uniref:DUF4376 domain-containing protein n=1 Tax=Bradyrhizobium japonicum TaxID=375 RepID=UPI0027149A2E|nr:DUF4376 domain-containing protein [Bradyrhizobium japonicum]WLB66021.1 DUF4376 domain-containing protein [Bradyrhizobium japonicum]
MFNPYAWYWRADDGRIFASARQITVDETDPDFIAFSQQTAPTPWPRDEAAEQTAAELQRVLFPYQIAVDLKAYAFYLRQQKEHDGCPVTGVTGMTEVRTDLNAQTLINRYHQVAASNAAFTAPWVLPDRSTVMLDQTAINALFDQTSAFIVGTYTTYNEVVTGIDGGSITTIDQIDQAFGASLQRNRPPDIGWTS